MKYAGMALLAPGAFAILSGCSWCCNVSLHETDSTQAELQVDFDLEFGVGLEYYIFRFGGQLQPELELPLSWKLRTEPLINNSGIAPPVSIRYGVLPKGFYSHMESPTMELRDGNVGVVSVWGLAMNSCWHNCRGIDQYFLIREGRLIFISRDEALRVAYRRE